MTLFQAKVGEKVTVTGFTLSYFYVKRLVNLGITKESVIEICGISPFGGTLKIKVNGVNFAVGKKISEGITVKYV